MTGRRKVAVALSGGVDSAAAAAILKGRGFEVVGITALIPRVGGGLATALEEARSVALALRIPHEVVDLRDEFERLVIEPFLAEYLAGRTPNPCVVCNRRIKFGLLMEQALRTGCDAFATGHYTRVEDRERGPALLRAGDERKDQAYVLWQLSRPVLSRLMFPLGDMTREEAAEVTRLAGVTRTAAESQDACFMAGTDLASLFDGHPSVTPGPILDARGNVLGGHRGLARYTIGQRHGLGLGGDRAYYVLEIRPEDNALVVGSRQDLPVGGFTVGEVSFVGESPPAPLECRVRTRYRGPALPCRFEPGEEGSGEVLYDGKGPEAVPGQSAVFYAGDEVLGGGLIVRKKPPPGT
ncbi:MAG: tRNA 2-thiouridine(34) synthase MnmA [Actinobacteria bacterium]|nr:tRNA 2-thiouridine(34) synthase MnmA [Actinomycetota bacterium]MBU1942654.1 tRNA 2-thiouridine(34) synthase MnmA [Actinomycetota bacterium]MBU2685976.1 tRNA 2-thiouridine(34) synthase MnmA [Actinomycetota bacterium]